MSAQSDDKQITASAMGSFGQLKSVKILDKALMAFGGKKGRDVKFVIKDLSKPEHYTMVMRVKDPKTLEIDLHLTHEGTARTYEPIVRVELDMSQWEQITEERAKKVIESAMEKVDLNNPDKSIALAEYLPVRSIFRPAPSSRRLEITKDSAESGFGDRTLSFNQFLAGKDSVGVIWREHKRAVEMVVRLGTEMYLINIDRLMNGMLKLLGFDTVEKAIDDALKAYKERTRASLGRVIGAVRPPDADARSNATA